MTAIFFAVTFRSNVTVKLNKYDLIDFHSILFVTLFELTIIIPLRIGQSEGNFQYFYINIIVLIYSL